MILPSSIALALSGGGIRAIGFHLGVIRLLAERCLLEHVERISTVSGGSLLVGLILQANQYQWPSSDLFIESVYPNLRNSLCNKSFQWGALRQLLNPVNLPFVFSRANLLALAIEKEWNIRIKLSELPIRPEWSINATTAENGKRFRFKRSDIGDYQLGYASAGDFHLSSAMAVSAAFPGGFGPLRLDATLFNWQKREWNSLKGTEQPVNIGYKSLHLYDGGVYDNLGLEPFFDAGRSKAKHPGTAIIVSDAGRPLPSGFDFFSLNPFRLKRVADIMSDQSHALRVRTFSNYLQESPGRGAFIYIGTPIEPTLPCKSATYTSNFPTTLRRIDLTEFDLLANHGYQVAKLAEQAYGL
ncbi:MAG: patatin-like phospholipase family protein [Nitrospiraceae bacterium]|nr:patatin-like phospholipase family protein [Nitrospiraceae bacterium]